MIGIWEYSLESFQWIKNPLYKFDTEFENKSPNFPFASIPLKTVTDDIPDEDQILLISQIYRQAGSLNYILLCCPSTLCLYAFR